MNRNTRRTLSIRGLVAALGVATALVAATSNAAQAYSPDPYARLYYKYTSNCPCSGGALRDPFDGTYFAKDNGGKARKIELEDRSGWFVGKVEFHPKAEKLWVYDTRNDGDTFYVSVFYYDGDGDPRSWRVKAAGTSRVVDKTVVNMNIPEGTTVSIDVYDNRARTDLITGTLGRA